MAQQAQFATGEKGSRTWKGQNCKYAIQVGVMTLQGKFIMLPNGSLGFDETHLILNPTTFIEKIQNKILEHILQRDELKKLGPQESWFLGTLEVLKLSFRIKNMAREKEDDIAL